ncbi:MFS transporter [Lysinibacillus capsici]|jgi:Major Facilitator Superfamily|uniref:MFS transporter n=1 Tax=Lysinibacillus capsici TaxID=2115968 RepID=A0A2X0XHZ8_9BACI|nr:MULTISPECIES: MFS transporter [Lysinibacillus]KMN39272.1 permease [Lysinibacillus sp. LK3]MCR6523782.1 MFS transporter [Lysinibacillus capsici]MCT1539592.1 MFS transporter [Lysinibacillus capsici]MCT1570341.1 MFS transporter [Lysinibacillus capsici]MCT1647751.1 MFS transporter [Lysinibacillus capsici]
MRKALESWRYPAILLCSIGVSSVGEWIYFIALNLIVLNLTESALAVSGLYIVRAISSLFTNFWSGSLIDRFNKKKLMIFLNLVQSILIVILPCFSSLLWMYVLVFLITVASSMYQPTSMTYITKLIPVEQRKRFNALRSLLDSGAFLTGPAIAGFLFTVGTPYMAIYLNAIALFLSACITFKMPNIEALEKFINRTEKASLFRVLLLDWQMVIRFSLKNSYVMVVYLLFSAIIILMTATDSLEAAFATQILALSEGEYGILVSIAGVGVLFGSLTNSVIVEKIPTSWLIGMGSLVTALGYLIFTSSFSFLIAAIGCFVLSFATAFANTGFYTFYQNNIPSESMGRIGSIYGFFEALFIIIFTTIFGIFAEWITIRSVVISASFMMAFVAVILLWLNIKPSKSHYYKRLISSKQQ